MKRTKRFIRITAAGVVLAFAFSIGISAQAKTTEDLTKVTEISESEFDSLKPEGEVTLKQKQQVVGDILLQAGVPEFVVRKMDSGLAESLYESAGFEVQVNYFQESPDGKLKQISYEQRERISKYNEKLERKRVKPLSEVVQLNADDGILVSDPVREISNLVHILIVGAKLSNGERLLSTVAAWETPPAMRLKDVIGVSSDKATTNDNTAQVSMDYSVIDYGTGKIEEFNEEFIAGEEPSSDCFSGFIEGTQGVAIEVDLPNNYTMSDPATGEILMTQFVSNIIIGINVMSKTESSVYKVVGQYYHKKLTFPSSVGISSSGFSFSVSPQFVFDDSTVSIPIGFST